MIRHRCTALCVCPKGLSALHDSGCMILTCILVHQSDTVKYNLREGVFSRF